MLTSAGVCSMPTGTWHFILRRSCGTDDAARSPEAGSGMRVRLLAAALHLLQPVPRLWGLVRESARFRSKRNGRRELAALSGPVEQLAGGVLQLPVFESRTALVPRISAYLNAS